MGNKLKEKNGQWALNLPAGEKTSLTCTSDMQVISRDIKLTLTVEYIYFTAYKRSIVRLTICSARRDFARKAIAALMCPSTCWHCLPAVVTVNPINVSLRVLFSRSPIIEDNGFEGKQFFSSCITRHFSTLPEKVQYKCCWWRLLV